MIDCTTLIKNESPAIGVCGEADDSLSMLTCEEVAGYVNQTQQTCLSNGKVGGICDVHTQCQRESWLSGTYDEILLWHLFTMHNFGSCFTNSLLVLRESCLEGKCWEGRDCESLLVTSHHNTETTVL